jgi:hypothetical protein
MAKQSRSVIYMKDRIDESKEPIAGFYFSWLTRQPRLVLRAGSFSLLFQK